MPPEDFDFEKLNATLTSLGSAMQSVQQSVESLGERVATVERGGNGGGEPPAPQYQPPSFDSSELESLSRGDFAKYLMNAFSEMLKHEMGQTVGELQKNVQGVQQTTVASEMKREIEKLESEKKDFWDWKSEMIELRKENPNLSISRLYALARAENPDKAQELDKKYTPPPADEGKPKEPAFGGFFPSSMNTEENTSMKPDEAATKAWDDTFGQSSDLNQLFQATGE